MELHTENGSAHAGAGWLELNLIETVLQLQDLTAQVDRQGLYLHLGIL